MRGRTLVAMVTLTAFTTLGSGRGGHRPQQARATGTRRPRRRKLRRGPAVGRPRRCRRPSSTSRPAATPTTPATTSTAIREFKAAEALRPSPILDYNIGLANEKLGKRRVAVEVLPALPRGAARRGEPRRGRGSDRDARGGSSRSSRRPPPNTQPGGRRRSAAPRRPRRRPTCRRANPNAGKVQGRPTGLDPYASQAPPGQPAKPAKKKSYWWVGLIVAGGVTLIVVLTVVTVVVCRQHGRRTYYARSRR